MTDVLALDLATTTGFARGKVEWRCVSCDSTESLQAIRDNGKRSCCPERDMQIPAPVAGSVRFGPAIADDNEIFVTCWKWICKLLEPQPCPDLIVLEAMLPPGAKVGATRREVRDRLAGLHAIVRAAAVMRGINDIMAYSVGDVRSHFIGDRTLKRKAAKHAVMVRCAQLGWQAEDDNAGDALALWSFAAARLEPDHALTLSPLFNKHLRVPA